MAGGAQSQVRAPVVAGGRGWPLVVGYASVALWLGVIVAAAWTTWLYQSQHAGQTDGLETLYVQLLGLPWIWLPLGLHVNTDHQFTALATGFDVLNWLIGSTLILLIAHRLAGDLATRQSRPSQ